MRRQKKMLNWHRDLDSCTMASERGVLVGVG